MGSADGLEYLGTEKGKRKYLARLVRRDPHTGKKVLDTKRVILAHSKGDALTKRDDLIEEELAKRAGTLLLPARKKLGEVGDAWFAQLEGAGTRISWGSHLKKIKAALGEWWLDKVTTDDLQRFLANVKGDRKLADGRPRPLDKGTINSIRDVLVKIYEFAIDQGYTRTNVAAATRRIRVKKSRKQLLEESELPPKRNLETAELERFLKSLRQHEHDAFPLVVVQLLIGCRFAEVSALRWSDVDLDTGFIVVRRGQVRGEIGPTKGKYARPSALGPSGLQLLLKHRREMQDRKWPGYEELIFPRPWSTRRRHSNHWSISTTSHAIKRTFTRLGWTLPVATHVARHTMNNIAAAHAGETMLRKVVGHTSVEMSARYRNPGEAEVIDFAARVEKALGGAKLLKAE